MTFMSQNAPLNQTQMTLSFSDWAEAITAMVRRFADRHVMTASLGNLSDKYLRDIGLTRNDVSSIACAPLPSSGALELSNIAKSRSGNW